MNMGIWECQYRGSVVHIGESGGRSVRCRGGVDCVLLGHILHVIWIKCLSVMFLLWWWDMGIRYNGGSAVGSGGSSRVRISSGKTTVSGVASLLRKKVQSAALLWLLLFISFVFNFSVSVFFVNVFAFSKASSSNVFFSKTKIHLVVGVIPNELFLFSCWYEWLFFLIPFLLPSSFIGKLLSSTYFSLFSTFRIW